MANQTPLCHRGYPSMRSARGRVALIAAIVVSIVAVSLPTQVAAAPSKAQPPVPQLTWADCGGGFQCATANVPLDYRQPLGPTIALAVIRLTASDPTQRIGSLFLNPGGPGGSGVLFLRFAAPFLPAALRARFDLVSFDPRGVNFSTPVRCFASVDEQQTFFSQLPPFPVGTSEERAYITAFERFDQLCGARNANLLPHMSTANAARDLDLLRAAVGEDRLTYLGLSYGTFLGASYLNLFPDRVRAVILDGVLDPVEWTIGSDSTGFRVPFSTRLKSDAGAFKTLGAFFSLCAQAGAARCAFAMGPDEPEAEALQEKFATLMQRLREHPLAMTTPVGVFYITYALVVSVVLGALYSPAIWPLLGALLQDLWMRSDATAAVAFIQHRAALQPLPYDNGSEAGTAVFCADSDNPHNPFAWPRAARQADERSPYFGSAWTWLSIPCASWPVRDRDRYVGPWNRTTSSPVLVIGNTFDPATRYEGAVALSHDLARARLLTLDGWGHTSFGKSSCIEQFEVKYLVAGLLPPAGTVCKPDQSPFGPITNEDLQRQEQIAAIAEPRTNSLPGG